MNLKNPPPDVIPFYIEIVDDNNDNVPIPFPPYPANIWTSDYKIETLIKSAQKNGNTAYAVKLLVNPSSLSINMAKIINRTQTMVGWLEEHWGEELDTVTFQGSTASFVSGQSNTLYDANKAYPISNATGYGNIGLISNNDRRNTISYRNMKSLVKIFGTNGVIYGEDGFVAKRFNIQITYDYASYRGYFESFDITEDAGNPYRFNYTVTFKAEKVQYKLGAKNNLAKENVIQTGISLNTNFNYNQLNNTTPVSDVVPS